jgi:hypothetical protein
MKFISRVEKNPPSLKVEDSLMPVLLYTILSFVLGSFASLTERRVKQRSGIFNTHEILPD